MTRTRDRASVSLWLVWLLAACGGQQRPAPVGARDAGAAGARATGGSFAAKLDASTASGDAVVDGGAYHLPAGCVPDDPGGPVNEAYATVSCGEASGAPSDAGSDPAVPGCLTVERGDGTITLETRLDYSNNLTFTYLNFDGPTSHGTPGRCSLHFPSSDTCADLVGQTLTWKGAGCWLACLPPDAEAGRGGVSAIRDSTGKLLAVQAGMATQPDGGVVSFPEVTPEFTVRWIRQPQETCSLRRVALELTLTKTGEKVVGEWERRTPVDIDGQHYVLVITTIQEPAAGGCGDLIWLLYRTDLLYPK